MVSDSERTKILEMIEDGTITAEEGLKLLNILDSSPEAVLETEVTETVEMEAEAPATYRSPGAVFSHAQDVKAGYAGERFDGEVEVMPSDPAPPSVDEIEKWKRWGVIPLWIGAAVTVIGGLLMYWAYAEGGFGFWFACAWFPFFLGVALLGLAWSSRTAPWLHVRVHQSSGSTPQKIAISIPIPIRLTVWGLRTFGHHIPNMEGINLDEVILALKDVAKDGTPFFVDVNEGEGGERVQVFIG